MQRSHDHRKQSSLIDNGLSTGALAVNEILRRAHSSQVPTTSLMSCLNLYQNYCRINSCWVRRTPRCILSVCTSRMSCRRSSGGGTSRFVPSNTTRNIRSVLLSSRDVEYALKRPATRCRSLGSVAASCVGRPRRHSNNVRSCHGSVTEPPTSRINVCEALTLGPLSGCMGRLPGLRGRSLSDGALVVHNRHESPASATS